MKQKDIDPEEAMKQIQKIFKKRGTKALEMARKEILQEKIKCKEAKEALTYFMTKYWQDLARPSLLSLVCEAVGGDPEITTPIAVPMILISGAIDIHDDIIDQSKRKGGRLTVYGKFGKDIALLVGDALLFKGLSLLNKAIEKGIPAEKMPLIMDIIKDMFFELGDAEAMELLIRRRIDILPKRYLQIVRKKAADVEAHTRIGTILGGGSRGEIEAMGHFGRLLGMMIILRDDWIDLIDLEESRQRIKRESLPLPVLYGLQNPQVKPKLKPILLNDTLRKKDAQTILKTVYNSKAMEQYEDLMDELAKNASSKLMFLKYNKEYLELLIKATLPPVGEFRKERS
jgi:geranylgeranyl pyrophosphate synthase